MIHEFEFRGHLKSQEKHPHIIDSYIKSIKDYINWLTLNDKEPTELREQTIEKTISYTIFEGTHNISL